MNSQISKVIKNIYDGKIKLDVCELKEEFIKKHAKSGASDTAILFTDLIFNMKDQREWKLKVPTILKIFLIPPKSLKSLYYVNAGIVYEANVYNVVINKIIADNLSPNFIGSFGYGECKFSQITGNLRDNETRRFFTKFMNNYRSEYRLTVEGVKQSKFGLIVNEAISDGSMLNVLYNEVSDEEQTNMLFQIIYALAVMSKFRLIHNDLHSANILVKKLKMPVTLYFNIGNKLFEIKTRYIPMLFDWDRAYCDLLGPNIELMGEYCEVYNTCNSFKNNFDLAVLLCTLQYDLPHNLEKLRGMYYNREISHANSKTKFSLMDEEYKELMKFTPLATRLESGEKVYKLSRDQFKTVMYKMPEDEFDKVFPRMLNFSVVLRNNRSLQILNVFDCRPNINIKGTLSPEQILRDSDVFDNLLTNNNPNKFFYKFPEKEYVKRKVTLDPRIQSTRDKIEGKPRFPMPNKY